MRHVIRDEILNFSFFGLNYHKRAKMCGSLIMHGSFVYESLKKILWYITGKSLVMCTSLGWACGQSNKCVDRESLSLRGSSRKKFIHSELQQHGFLTIPNLFWVLVKDIQILCKIHEFIQTLIYLKKFTCRLINNLLFLEPKLTQKPWGREE